MATTALADRSASGGPRVAFTSGVWCDAALPPIKHDYRDAVLGRYNRTMPRPSPSTSRTRSRCQFRAMRIIILNFLTLFLIWLGFLEGRESKKADQRVDAAGDEGPHQLCPAAGIHRPDDGHRARQRHLPRRSRSTASTSSTTCRTCCRATPNSTSPCKTGSRCSSSTTARRISITSPRKRGRGGSNDDDLTKYAMVIFLPDVRDGLRGLVEKMASRPNRCGSASSWCPSSRCPSPTASSESLGSWGSGCRSHLSSPTCSSWWRTTALACRCL
ncbi:hypothetical protein OsI_35832 [Oryza sativa Indica Group]|uniref:Uncharacterized protein n=1 Tax=Oryza sativa subsp. indica TaxID=39946 RepID=A2ZDH0_ORYSI|nr:hypothetical protein OsI_35832 [Oryza sativa Indica Group]